MSDTPAAVPGTVEGQPWTLNVYVAADETGKKFVVLAQTLGTLSSQQVFTAEHAEQLGDMLKGASVEAGRTLQIATQLPGDEFKMGPR